MNKHLFHKILYSFEPSFIEIGNVLLKEGDKVESIFIILSGTLEIFASFEDNEFIVEKLQRGSVLNYRNIFNGDDMNVGVRASENTHLLELSSEKFMEIRESNKIYANKVTMWENQLLRSGRTTPLDFIVGTIGKPRGAEKSKKNKNMLKNIIYERCLEVRIQKSKPSLKDILRVWHSNPKYTKNHILQMINVLYANSSGPSIEIEDEKFNYLNGLLEGMKTIFAI